MKTKIKLSAIYMWTNTLNGKRYIGQSIDLEKRLNSYKNGHFKGQKALYAAFKKYGKENFAFEILWSSTVEDLDALNTFERDFIYLFDTLGENGYNLKEGGKNGKHSEETKKRLREAHLGKKHTEETKQKLSKINLGRKPSEETKKKLSESLKGNKCALGAKRSEETKQKISNAKKGNSYCLGYKHTEEFKKKISESKKGKKQSEEHRLNRAKSRMKAVLQCDLNGNELNEFNSVKEAAKFVSGDLGSISKCCKGSSYTHKGFTWKYKDND